MSAKKQIPKDKIRKIALELVRSDGFDALNARNLAKAIGCSTQPIYLAYKNMAELKTDIITNALSFYNNYLENYIKECCYDEYEAIGMAYIAFAKDEKELFKLLFMRDRTDEYSDDGSDEFKQQFMPVMKADGIDAETEYSIHVDMWIFVHGIAVMSVTSYMNLSEAEIKKRMEDVYIGLLKKYNAEGEI